ncbi:Ankyrin-3, partial [Frankliniella fusca]
GVRGRGGGGRGPLFRADCASARQSLTGSQGTIHPCPRVHPTEWLRRGRAVEYSLGAAWREACALCLPLGEEVAKQVVTELVRLRYRLSAENTTSDSPPVDDLWSRVDLLQEYLDRLDGELEGLRGNENTPGAADLSVMLANLCALVLHSVKFDFQLTYVDVPWEEMEYLLVMYIEARSVFETVSHTVVTAERAVAYLRCFRELAKKHVLVHRDGAESEKLKKKRDDQKPAPPVGTVDNELARLQRDFSHLRDFNSLKEAAEALRVAQDALLDRTDDAWASYGWLALRWALFVVGERFKYSWLSPNLSPRWAVLVDAIAPGGIRKIMSTIRDDQEHAEEHSNSKTLAFVDMEMTKRKELADELEKLRKACLVAIDEILLEKDYKSDSEETVDFRKMSVVNDTLHNDKNRIIEEVMNCLKPAASYAGEEFKHLTDLISSSFRKSIPGGPLLKDCSTKLEIIAFCFKHKHVIDMDRVIFLLNSRSVENTTRFQRRLEKVNKLCQGSAPMEKLIKALQDTPREPNAVGIFAVLGGVRELASRWHEEDTTVPTIIPFSPALFGRQLRNYLNHLDEVFSASNCLDPFSLNYPREILQLGFLFRCEGFEDIASQSGARPNPFDLQWSRNECERLLKLIKLKGDMFRHAREGHLEKLQHLVEERGGHVSARDRQNRTLMHAAAQGGQLPVVEWLLRTRAVDPLAEDWRGNTALDVAATGDVAQVLLQELPPASRKENVASFLISAALEGREELVQVLLSAGPDVNAAYRGVLTPLIAAAASGHERVVQLLMKAGARPHAGGPPDTHPTLKYAALSGSAATVRLLLDADPPPDPADCWAAARIAAACGHEEAFSALLHELVEQRSARDQPSWRDDLYETLEAASRGGSSAIVSMLLDCDPAAMLAIRGADSALQAAVLFDHTELSRDLIKRGADPLSDVDEVTALDCAAHARGASADTLRDLLHHARQHCPAEGLQRALPKALWFAAAAGRLEAVKMFVRHGADINGVVDGTTPLTGAAGLGQHEVVRWLLEQGADQLLGDAPALHMATGYGRLRIVKQLVAPPQPSALRQAVMASEKGVLERVLQQFVTHLALARGHVPARTPSRVSRSDRRRAEAENKRVLLWWRKRVLVVVQKVNSYGRTALHLAAATSALPTVKHLLKTEEELLRQVYGKGNSTKTEQDGLTVYARMKAKVDQADKGSTALSFGVRCRCAPEVAEALLQRMSNEMWMALGGQTLPEVRVMAAEALVLAASTKFYSASTARALCWWISRSAEGLRATSGQPLLGAQGAQALQDIRRRAVAALDSARSEAVLEVLRPVLVPEQLPALSSCPFPSFTNMEPIDWTRVMTACFVYRNLGKENCRDEVDEMAAQLLCVWLRDFTGTDPEAAVTRAACEALRISTVVQDRSLYALACGYLWDRWVRKWPRLRGGQRRALFMLAVLSELEEGYVNSESERVRWEQSKKKKKKNQSNNSGHDGSCRNAV